MYFAYSGDRDMTDKVTINYLLIYWQCLTTCSSMLKSSSWIPGMDAFVYHEGWYTVFYALHDPLDNAVPSLRRYSVRDSDAQLPPCQGTR